MSSQTHIAWTPVVVEWHSSLSTSTPTTIKANENVSTLTPSSSSQAESHASHQIHAHLAEFRLFYAPSSNTAAFMLRAPVNIRGPTKTTEKSFVYLILRPELVLSLVHSPSSNPPPRDGWVFARTVKQMEKTRSDSLNLTSSLRFTLASPAPLVANSSSLLPKTSADSKALDSLYSLASQTDITLHVGTDALPDQALLSIICRAASTDGSLKSSSHMDLSSLYRGENGGGKLVLDMNQPALRSQAGSGADEQLEADLALPSYQELGPPPPPALHGAAAHPSSSKKRRYDGSGTEDPGPHRHGPTELADTKFREAFDSYFAERLPELRRQVSRDIESEVQQQLEQMRSQVLDHVNDRLAEAEEARRQNAQQLAVTIQDSCTAIRAEFTERMQKLEGVAASRDEATDDLDDKLRDLDQDLNSRVEELEEQVGEICRYVEGEVHERVDECSSVLRAELEQFIQDEVVGAQEQIEDCLRQVLHKV
ncbi:hypothetical protein DHEL01_v211584 [Diaporthe helianthi]|uniref:Uncharacterized protein n=1 Tax=Diaporthe helianthi TaxID=158607 RepID=A0A2P5HIE1_DIAHE|nr:hypothetical protein DHEL01_v211584 [Diaporthe helianthi]